MKLIKLDRSEINKIINEMKLFDETYKAIEAYYIDLMKREKEEELLQLQLEDLRNELRANLFEQESATVSEKVYLRIKQKEISLRMEAVTSVLADVIQEKSELKVKHAPLFLIALQKDAKRTLGLYNANVIIDKMIYEMLLAISDIGKEMRNQYNAIASDIRNVLEDEKVKEAYKEIENSFYS